MDNMVNILRNLYGEDEPILLDEIIAAFPNVTRMTVFNRLNKAIDDGLIEKYRRGVYFIPRVGLLGKVPLLPLKVIKKKYLSDGEEVFGYLSGLNLENEVGVSSQVPATLEITSNNASRRVREIEPFGGWREITLRTPRTTVTEVNVDVLRFLDLVTRLPIDMLGELEFENLRKLARSVDKDDLIEYSRYYPAKTSKKLLESEALGVFA